MSKDLIFEIAAEELPAAYIPRAMASHETYMRRALETNRISFSAIRAFGTPRRLALIVEGLAERQSDATIEVKGPQKKAAFDAGGNPTPALIGFARSQGVDINAITTVDTGKGEYAVAVKEIKGRQTVELLPEILTGLVSEEVFAKSMRWGGHDITFARPVHGLLAVYNGRLVEFNWGHIKSSAAAKGHRFLSNGRAVAVDTAASYIEGLREAFVIVDPAQRRRIISEGIEKAAADAGGLLVEDPGLVEEVSFLCEYPVVIRGGFDPEFLALPRDVVVNAMREHQRYFSIADKNDRLLPWFITVANTRPTDEAIVRKGNERVLRARLNDAKFYFEQDIKKPLVERVEALKGVIFHARLGTSYEKVERFAALALFISYQTGFSRGLEANEQCSDFLTESFNPAAYDPAAIDPGLYSKYVVGRGAMLAKADLTSGMVGEFPKLQGIMGGIYARRNAEAEEVAIAVFEHYLPTGSGGALPASVPGAIISVADKLDTIVGCFCVGLIPTGAQDPYALRRAALGIIAVIMDKGFRIPLNSLINRSIELHQAVIRRHISKGLKPADKGVDVEALLARKTVEARSNVVEFLLDRLRNQLRSQGIAFDSIDAVLAAPSNGMDIVDAVARITAVEGFKADPAFARLIVAFKRVSNIIVSRDGANRGPAPDAALFQEDAERALFETATRLSPLIEGYTKDGDYASVFTALASIKDDVDRFFDKVLVMADDPAIRANRMALLEFIHSLYYKTADLSRLNA
ncbi:MAG: glycine--tRNA ligase subunit beta [Deltaproteobacteria bacterium]|nr:glycine--tRNA ligase subunit beta [Deltaproteobacteria bacterium]